MSAYWKGLLCAGAISLGVTSAHAATFPDIGADVGGPALIITLNPGGTGTVSNGPNAGTPYDGVEDTYIGVINNSGQSVSSIVLSAPSNVGIFGFDGDGIATGPYSGTGIQQYGTNNPQDSTGYGGPNGFFTNITSNGGTDTGTLNFITALANGDFTWFSLEEPLTSASFAVTQVGNTPIPGALPLFASGLAGAAGMIGLRRRNRKATRKASA